MNTQIERHLSTETREWLDSLADQSHKTKDRLIAQCVELVQAGEVEGELPETPILTRLSDVESRINQVEKQVRKIGDESTSPCETLSFDKQGGIVTESIVVDAPAGVITISRNMHNNVTNVFVNGKDEIRIKPKEDGSDEVSIDRINPIKD